MHFYRPADGHGLAHDPFNAIVAPRPIGWIGTHDGHGRRNLAPYSFFNALNYHPPLVGFASVGWKGTVANCEATGEFTWNLVTRGLAAVMNATSTTADVDEFAAAGLTAEPGVVLGAPRVAQAPVHFECAVSQIVPLQAADGTQVGTWFVVGEVRGVHIAEELIVDGVFDTEAADPLLRAGGPTAYYGIDVAKRLDLRRPQ